MDTFDEKPDRDDDDVPARQGDILGLGGISVPKTAADPSTEYDAASIAQRRERAIDSEADDATPREDPDRQRSGATGIDMGAGGQGTHLSGK